MNKVYSPKYIVDKYFEQIYLVLIIALTIGLYYSKFLVSLVPYLILVVGLLRSGSKAILKEFFKNKIFTSLFLMFFIYLLSGINSINTSVWLSRLNTNLMFLTVPLSVFLMREISLKFIHKILIIFVLVNFFISLYLLGTYIYNIDVINKQYLTGRTIETPIIHPRYSYFVATSILFSLYLLYKRVIIYFPLERILYGVFSIFLLMFLHLLAVRTGILSLYITFVFMVFYMMFTKQKIVLGMMTLTLLVGMLVSSYFLLPSVKNKIDYVKWDISNTINNTASHHTSDRIRIHSIINGLKLLKDNPMFGVGIGDIDDEMDMKYNENYKDLPKDMRFPPVNQFVFILTSFGIIGFLFYFGFLIAPVFLTTDKHLLLIPFYMLTFSSFIGETTIELLIGKTAFLFLVSILLKYTQKREELDSV